MIPRCLRVSAVRRYSTAGSTPASSAKPTAVSRFWKRAFAEESTDGFRIKLDGRPLKNPEGAEIIVPSQKKFLASLIAAEWEAQDRLLKSSSLPLTSITVRGIEFSRSRETCQGVIDTLFRYLDTDSILYMQDGPSNLVTLQEKYWSPIINWAKNEFQIEITPTFEIFSVRQSQDTVEKLRCFAEQLTPMQLAAFERAVLSSKSFLIGTALVKRGISVDFATEAARVEVTFQVQKWGEVLDAHDVEYQALRRDLGSVMCCLIDKE